MATPSRNSQTGKTNSTGKSGSSTRRTPKRQAEISAKAAKTRKANERKREIYKDIFLLVVLLICILLFISNFGIGGVVGNAISGFFFGLWGLVEYVFPILLLMACFFATSNRNNSVARVKILFAALALILVCTFIQLITNSIGKVDYRSFTIGGNYFTCRDSHTGGGFLGALLCKGFVSWFGQVAAYIITIILTIICVVLITGKAFFAGVKKGGQRIGEQVAYDFDQYKEDTARKSAAKEDRKKRESKLKRTKQKVHGVALDTTIEEDDIQDVHEIRPDSTLSSPSFEELTPENMGKDYYHYEKVETPRDYTPASKNSRTAMPTESQETLLEHYQEEQNNAFEDTVEELEFSTNTPQLRSGKDYLKPGNVYDGTHEDEWIQMPAPATKETPARESVYTTETTARVNEKPGTTGRGTDSAADTDRTQSNTPAPAAEEEFVAVPAKPKRTKRYVFPLQKLLKTGSGNTASGNNDEELRATAGKLNQILSTFGVDAHVVGAEKGPAVTRYELEPKLGVKVSRIVSLADDIKLGLAATNIRIEAPIPGKSLIGIEVPNKENSGVALGDLIRSNEFRTNRSKIAFCVGKDISGKNIIGDIAKMPHVLIAGATGSGKSVCINTIIMSILYHATPDEVKLIMVDPKVVELNVYNGIPHLLSPVVTDAKKAAGALNWAVNHMMERYDLFAKSGCKDITSYNEKVEKADAENPEVNHPAKLPQIVIIIDELADLMMVASKEVEDAIVRLAQLARAAGIHLVIATQRPSVNVITGLIKANVPSRIAFTVASAVDSRTILDMGGADKLLGRGDMLYYPAGTTKPVRVQGAFVSEEEVIAVVDYVKENNSSADYDESVEKSIATPMESAGVGTSEDSDTDELFVKAGYAIIEKERASIGMLQRMFKIGFNRAARIMDQLGEIGLVGPEEGTKPRKILMTKEEFDQYLQNNQ